MARGMAAVDIELAKIIAEWDRMERAFGPRLTRRDRSAAWIRRPRFNLPQFVASLLTVGLVASWWLP